MYFIAVLYIEQVCKIREHVKNLQFNWKILLLGGGDPRPQECKFFFDFFFKEGGRFEMKICIIFFCSSFV